MIANGLHSAGYNRTDEKRLCGLRLPPLRHAPDGTPYLRAPGVSMLAKPDVNIAALADFLDGFAPELHFPQYLDDPTLFVPRRANMQDGGTTLLYVVRAKTHPTTRRPPRYFRNIMESGHGSVLEHANFTFLFYGISRSVTHELVRHRAGMAFSQVSQRYVSGRVLRFVERPEYQNDDALHDGVRAAHRSGGARL